MLLIGPRHPCRWFTMVEPFAYLSATQSIGDKPVKLNPGERFTARFALVILKGEAAPERIEVLYKDLLADPAFSGK